MIQLGNGSLVAVAKTYATAVAMSAVSNATEAVATLAASHGVVVGDYLEITSGWGLLDRRVVRVKTVATNDVTLETIDSSNTSRFPAGNGIGSVRRITAWTTMSKVKDLSFSGGEQKYTDATALEDDVESEMPTSQSPVKMELTVFDDPSLPWVADVAAADAAGTPYAVRVTTRGGAKIVANAYWSMPGTPDIKRGEIISTKISLSLAARLVRYAS